MALSRSPSPRLPDAEHYQHDDTLVTAEARAWMSDFHAEVELARRLQAQKAATSEIMTGKTEAEPEPARAERRLAPWEVLSRRTPTPPVKGGTGHDVSADAIREALEAKRTEFYLQPIAGMKDRKVRFYEGLTRLRDARGKVIMPAVYLPLAMKAGLACDIDNLLMLRCLRVLESFKARKYDFGVFCNFSRQALQNQGFYRPFLELMEKRRDLADSLIFEFSQDVLNAFGQSELNNLIGLADLGFHFSLDNVHDLNMNFEKLHQLGFRYIKVDSDILLKGEDRAGMNFVTVLLAQQVRESGLKLIAQKLEIQDNADILFNYGLRLGQGYLFGKPRLIRPPAAPRTVANPAPQRRRATG